jgi:hypothetical protein
MPEPIEEGDEIAGLLREVAIKEGKIMPPLNEEQEGMTEDEYERRSDKTRRVPPRLNRE